MPVHLSLSVLAAFNSACNARNLTVAEKLYAILPDLNVTSEVLVEAQERLWLLRNLKNC
jgi:hypothetical protein